MDEPIKLLPRLIITMLASLLLISIVSFGLVVKKAENVLYTVVDYIESNGYNSEVINDYANQTGIQINVTSTTVDDGIYSPGEERYRYKVEVTFSHVLGVFSTTGGGLLRPTITIKQITRALQF